MRTSVFDFTGSLDNRFGTLSAALVLSMVVFLILTAQVTLYFRRKPVHSCDPMWIKGVIIFVWILQALEIALSCHMTVLSHSQPHHMLEEHLVKKTLWEWGFYVAICVMTGSLVHSLFLYRIYLFERALSSIRVSIILGFVLLLEGSFGLLSVLCFTSIKSGAFRHDRLWVIPVWLGLSILADILIAGSFCYILRRSSHAGTGRRLGLVVKRLTRFFIQTGLITSLVGGATVAVWAAADLDPVHLWMSFPMGGVYATCLMANLLARGSSYLWPVQGDQESIIVPTGNIVFANPEDLEKDVEPGSVSCSSHELVSPFQVE